jgi:RNA-directed DNA polymerase
MNIVNLLSKELNNAGHKKDINDVLTFAIKAPNKYKVYSIPKRTAGLRTIAHPSKELKKYQKILSVYFQKNLPIHGAAFAYTKGVSIKDNAEQHKSNKYLLKMDFENFFNSITPTLLKKSFIDNNVKFSIQDINLIERLCFWCPSKKKNGKLVLSVGAPVSPVISNFIMYQFDCLISEWCKSNKIVYTRYADDISFSANIKGALFKIPKLIVNVLKGCFNNRIRIKPTKTIYSSKAHNRHITGVTINNEGELSLGRERKRYISSLIHQFRHKKLSEEDTLHLQGLLSFASHIEPIFLSRMMKKYTEEILNQLNQFNLGK